MTHLWGSNFLRRHYPDQVQGDPKLRFASISAEDAPQRPCFYVQYSVYTARVVCQVEEKKKLCCFSKIWNQEYRPIYNKVIENRQTPRGEKTRVRGCEQYHLWCCKKKKSPKYVKNSVKKESFVWQTAANQRKNCQNFTGEILRFAGRGPCMGRFIYAMILFVVLYL